MIVYKITNKITKLQYVGLTTKTIDIRWKQHLSKKSMCRKLKHAISKYGSDSFEIEIIDRAGSLEELNKKEEFWINKLNCIHPQGYNLKKGGRANTPCRETREKISKSLGGKSFKVWKIIKDNGEKRPNLYNVYEVQYLREYTILANFINESGLDRRNVYGCLRRKIKYIKGYILIFSDSQETIRDRIGSINVPYKQSNWIPFTVEKIIKDNGKSPKSSNYKIIGTKFVGVWENRTQCGRDLALKNADSKISACLSGSKNTYGGYIFKYIKTPNV